MNAKFPINVNSDIIFFAGCIYILVCIIINNYILLSLYYAIIVLYSRAGKFSRLY
jgi:hypothetical protein